MLAKLWKKVLLAICIIACLFNIMSKLVNRHSLKVNLESVDDGTVVFDVFSKKEEDEKKAEEPIDLLNGKETKQENKVENKTVHEYENNPIIINQEPDEEIVEENNIEEQVDEEVIEESNEKEKDGSSVSYSDFLSNFWNF